MTLIEELRSKKSRDNRALLDRAADRIEELEASHCERNKGKWEIRDEAKRYERYYFNHEYDKLISEAKAEVARGIFEELEKYFFNNEYKTGYLTYCNFFNIKKKYTEDKT